MAPKKAPVEKKDEKPKKPEMTPEMKELKAKEKALVKVPQPSRTELDANNEKTDAVIKGLQEKLKALNDQIGTKSVGKEEHFKARDEIRAKLDEYGAKIDALQKKRNDMQGSIKGKVDEAREQKKGLNDMKKKLGFETVGEIDARIREIETEMYTSSMTIKQEKEKILEIARLRKSKPMVDKFAAMESNLGVDGSVDGMKGSVADIQKELTELFEAKKLQSQAYSKLMEARQKVMGDVPALFEQREGINGQIREKIKARNEERDAFQVEMRAYNAFLSEQRNIRYELGKLEQMQRKSEWEGRQKDEEGDAGPAALPFDDDLQYLDNIMKYLKTHMPKEAEAAKEAVKAEAPKDIAGHMVMISKGQREEEFFFAPTKTKQLKKKGPGTKAKPIVHSMETLSFFDKYKLPTPADSAAVPATLKAVEDKIVEYKAKQVKRLADDKKKAENKDAPAADAAEATEPAAEKTEE